MQPATASNRQIDTSNQPAGRGHTMPSTLKQPAEQPHNVAVSPPTPRCRAGADMSCVVQYELTCTRCFTHGSPSSVKSS